MQTQLPIFSKAGYTNVLQNAQNNGYSFICFGEKDDLADDRKYCLMRHDIDTSLKCALEMAEIEFANNIRSTYFFMLRSPAYNLFGRYAHMVLDRIKNMGHEIALHFDAEHPAITGKELVTAVEAEVQTLSGLAEQAIHAVSFHQPSEKILKGDTNIPGIINTYHKEHMKGWHYTSDSNRVWKEYNALTVFENDFNKIQILVHPIWWMYDDKLVEDVWDKAVRDNFYIMQQQFFDTEGAYGVKREFIVKR